MGKNFKDIDLSKIKTYSINDRKSKALLGDFAKTTTTNPSIATFLESLPNILAAKELIEISRAIAKSNKDDKTVIFAMGAHVIKVGLSPIIIDLMKQNVISMIALNGAGIIHDFEVAYAGKTSEEVEEVLGEGSFGMAEETAKYLNEAISEAKQKGYGLGKAIGQKIIALKANYKASSILATAAELNIPVTVHVAIGTDIIHMHRSFNAEALGQASYKDFLEFTSAVASLEEGVYLNIGSAVILPEVFLKALTISRNLGYKVKNFVTANFDMFRHYRPTQNVVKRPTTEGKGYNIIGHHEIMIPLLYQAIMKEKRHV